MCDKLPIAAEIIKYIYPALRWQKSTYAYLLLQLGMCEQFYKDDCEDNLYAQRAYEGICSTSLSGYKIPTTDKRVL
jgi:hypothetical protein